MNHKTHRHERTTKWLRWIARIFGSLIVLFWLTITLAGGIVEPPEWETENIIMALLIVGSTIGVLLAWKVERIGGFITLLFGIAHSIFALFAAGHNHIFAMLVSGGPFIVIGILFLVASARSTGVKISNNSS